MLVSVEEAEALTGYQMIPEDIQWAQAIIEVYVGRSEPDVDDPRDLAMLARAVAFQAAYGKVNGTMIYEQVQVKSLTVGGTNYTFHQGDEAAPYIAPLAKMACSKLSWTRSRTVKTGRLNTPGLTLLDWWTED